MAIDNILLKLVETTIEMSSIPLSQGADISIVNVVLRSFFGSREDIPVLGNVHEEALINLDNEVVWEMFVSNFSHFGVLIFENPWAKVQHYKNYRSLLGESN
jgi:hypothetical protein